MTHRYSNTFFDYIDSGARSSAKKVISLLSPWFEINSVLDLGSGRGAWLAEWSSAGVRDIIGVDGEYVDQRRLVIPRNAFRAADLKKPVDMRRSFDLAQSLEVGEHLPEWASETLVDSLVRHSNKVLFSAAVPNQGGEFHINEQPLAFWQELFAEKGYHAYDCLRPRLGDDPAVEPWYKFNSVLYVNKMGQRELPESVLATRVPDGVALEENGDAGWLWRRRLVSIMPQRVVTYIARSRATLLSYRFQRHK